MNIARSVKRRCFSTKIPLAYAFVLAAAQTGYRPPLGHIANYPMSDNSWAKLLGTAGEGVYVSGYASV